MLRIGRHMFGTATLLTKKSERGQKRLVATVEETLEHADSSESSDSKDSKSVLLFNFASLDSVYTVYYSAFPILRFRSLLFPIRLAIIIAVYDSFMPASFMLMSRYDHCKLIVN